MWFWRNEMFWILRFAIKEKNVSSVQKLYFVGSCKKLSKLILNLGYNDNVGSFVMTCKIIILFSLSVR